MTFLSYCIQITFCLLTGPPVVFTLFTSADQILPPPPWASLSVSRHLIDGTHLHPQFSSEPHVHVVPSSSGILFRITSIQIFSYRLFSTFTTTTRVESPSDEFFCRLAARLPCEMVMLHQGLIAKDSSCLSVNTILNKSFFNNLLSPFKYSWSDLFWFQ